MVDFTTPNLPGANALFNAVAAKVESIDIAAVANKSKDAADVVDKLKAEVAMLAALNESKNTKVTWKSDKNPGVKGEIQTKKVSKNGNACKSVTQILIIDGEKTKEVNTLCRKSDGSWALS